MYFLWLNGTQVGPYSLEQLKSIWKSGQVDSQTLFWQEGLPNWQPLESIQHLLVEAKSSRMICGFWRRLGAYALDMLLLGAIGLVLGLFFFNLFSQMGAWALLVGFTISLLYFGLLNSAVGRGQTLGKRLLGLEVINHEGRHLSPGRTFPRYVIFALPFYLNGVLNSAGLVATSWTALILGALVFGGGGTIAYLYVFNRRTRQSLHDLAVGSYVVRTTPQGAVEAPPFWKGHLIVVAGLFLLTTGLATAAMTFMHVPFFEKLLAVQEAILSSGKVNSVSVTEGVNWSSFKGNSQSAKVLSVKAHWKEKPADSGTAAKEIVAIVLKLYPDVVKDDLLTITISSGYNIGIFSSSFSKTTSHSPPEWEKISESPSPANR